MCALFLFNSARYYSSVSIVDWGPMMTLKVNYSAKMTFIASNKALVIWYKLVACKAISRKEEIKYIW